MKALLERVAPPFVTLLVVLGAWEAAVRSLGIAAYLLPPPSAIARAAVTEGASLAASSVVTAQAALAGFALAAVVGAMAGVTLSTSRWIERGFYPYALFLQTVPIVAVAPLLVLWFGPGFRAVAVSAFIVAVFPVVANTLAGMRAVDRGLLDLFRLYRATRWQRLAKLEVPAALPNMVTGCRVASGLAVIGAIVGEFVAGYGEGAAGLGITVLASYRQLRTDLLFAAVGCASLLGLGLFALVGVMGAVLLRSREAAP